MGAAFLRPRPWPRNEAWIYNQTQWVSRRLSFAGDVYAALSELSSAVVPSRLTTRRGLIPINVLGTQQTFFHRNA